MKLEKASFLRQRLGLRLRGEDKAGTPVTTRRGRKLVSCKDLTFAYKMAYKSVLFSKHSSFEQGGHRVPSTSLGQRGEQVTPSLWAWGLALPRPRPTREWPFPAGSRVRQALLVQGPLLRHLFQDCPAVAAAETLRELESYPSRVARRDRSWAEARVARGGVCEAPGCSGRRARSRALPDTQESRCEEGSRELRPGRS